MRAVVPGEKILVPSLLIAIVLLFSFHPVPPENPKVTSFEEPARVVVCEGTENLALGKPATQSSNFGVTTAGVGVDGINQGNFGPFEANSSITHTNRELEAWWQVDLGAASELDSLRLFNRTDCCGDRLKNFYIFASFNPIPANASVNDLLTDAFVSNVFFEGIADSLEVIPLGIDGRYVRIQLTDENFLHFKEAEIYGCDLDAPPPTCDVAIEDVSVFNPTTCGGTNGSIQIQASGINLQYSIDGGITFQGSNVFSALTQGEYTIVARQTNSVTCAAGDLVELVDPEGCNPSECEDPENVALGKPVTMSSTYGDGAPELAVDGDTTGTTPWDPGVDLVHTDTLDFQSWLEVDLEEVFQVKDVVIYPREDCCPNQLSDFYILVSEDPIDTTSSLEELVLQDGIAHIPFPGAAPIGVGTHFNFSDSTLGRYVRVMSTDSSYIAFAELFVLGCVPDTTPQCFINIDSIQVSEISDCGLEDGVIEISSVGDSAEYSIDGGLTFQTLNFFPGLGEGTYPIMVRKIGSEICFDTATVSITAPVAPTIMNIAAVDPSGCDQLDGSISITAMGDSLEYSIDGGQVFQDSGLFVGLTGGFFNLVIREVERPACQATEIVTLSGVSDFSIDTVLVSHPTDCGETDGMIEVQATGDSLSYSLDGGTTYQDSSVFVGLAPDTYILTIRKDSLEDCFLARTITLLAPDQPTIDTIVVTAPTSCADEDGSIMVTATGDSLEYSLDGGQTFQDSAMFTGLTPGSYEVVIREVARPACLSAQTVTLDAPNTIEWVELVGVSPTDCGLSDGSITITVNGDSLAYSIDGGENFQDFNIFIGLGEGVYDVVVQQNGAELCRLQDTITLVGPIVPILDSVNVVLPTDCEAADGAISLFGTGDSLEYSVDGGNTFSDTNVFQGLASGGFNVVVREVGSLSCIAEDSITLVPANLPVITSIVAAGPTDCGFTDGLITINATGDSLEYSIDGGLSYQDTNFFSGLDSGPYRIAVREAGSLTCVNMDSVTLAALSIPVIDSLLVSQPSDCGLDDGSIIVVATGDSLEYSYDGGLSFTPLDTLGGLPGGTYDIVVRESGTLSCIAIDQVVLDSLVLPSISSLELVNPTDCGGADGGIGILAIGDSLEYSIDSGFTFTDTPVFLGLIAGDYHVVVREKGSATCLVEDTATLVDPALPVLTSVLATNPTDCGFQNGTISIAASGDSLEYSIDNGLSYSDTNTFQGLNGGTYFLSIRSKGAVSCMVMDTAILVDPVVPEISDIASTQPTDCGLEDGTILITGVGTALEYSIDSGATYLDTGFFSGLPIGVYQIIVREAGTASCFANAEVELTGPSKPELVEIELLDPQDCGFNDGAINIVATGQNLEYSINGGDNFQFSNLFPNLRTGTYSLVLRDSNFPTCTVDTTVTLTDSIWCGQITCVEPTNVAFGKTVSSSGTSTPAELGVDGITEGIASDGPAPELVVLSTRTDSLEPFYDINLGSVHNLEEIKVYPRMNCCPEDLQDFFVIISSRPFGNRLLPNILADTSIQKFQYVGKTTDGMPIEFVMPEGSFGQFIRLTHPSPDSMVFAEIEVIGCGLGSPQFYLYSAADTSQLVEPDPFSLIEIYPNPFRSNFTIDLGQVDTEVAIVRMINALGQVVYSTTLSTQRILQIGNNLSPGMYWVEIEYATRSEQFKIIKMR